MKLLLICLFLFSSPTFALPMEDSANVLGQIDQFLDSPPFEKAFTPGDWVLMAGHGALYGNSTRLKETVVEADSDHIVYRVDVDGGSSQIQSITRNDYEAAKGNPIRLKLAGIQIEGDSDPRDHIEVLSVVDGTYALEDGTSVKTKTVVAAAISYSTNSDIPTKMPFAFSVAKSPLALGTLVEAKYFGTAITEKVLSFGANAVR